MSWLKRIFSGPSVGKGSVRVYVGNDSPVTSVDLSGNGRLAVAGTMGGGQSYSEVQTIGVISGPPKPQTKTKPLINSPLRQWVGGAVELWSVDRGERLHVFEGHRKPVRAVAMNHRGRLAVSAGDDNTLCLWDLKKRELRTSIDTEGCDVMALAMDAEGKRVLVGGGRGYLVLWASDTDRAWPLTAGRKPSVYTVRAVDLNDDATKAVTAGDDGIVSVWDLKTGVCLHRLYGHQGSIQALAMSGEADVAASGGDDGHVRMWDLARGQCIRTLRGHSGGITALAITRDARTVVSAGVSSGHAAVRVWDVVSDVCRHTFRGHRKAVSAVRITPDEDFVLSASHDGTLQLWAMPG